MFPIPKHMFLLAPEDLLPSRCLVPPKLMSAIVPPRSVTTSTTSTSTKTYNRVFASMSSGGTRASRREKVLGGSEEHLLGDGEHNVVVMALAMRVGFGGSVDW